MNTIYYFNQRLTDQLNEIFRRSMTLIEAAAGLGKTTAVNAYLDRARADVLRHHVSNSDLAGFYVRFCDMLSLWDEKSAAGCRQVCEKAGPGSAPAPGCAVVLKKNLRDTSRRVYLVEADSLQEMDAIAAFLLDLAQQRVPGLRIILSIDGQPGLFDPQTADTDINRITEWHFRLTEDEIIQCFAQQEISLAREEAHYILRDTQGSIHDVIAQLVQMKEEGKDAFWQRQVSREGSAVTRAGSPNAAAPAGRPAATQTGSPNAASARVGSPDLEALWREAADALLRADIRQAEILRTEACWREKKAGISSRYSNHSLLLLRLAQGRSAELIRELQAGSRLLMENRDMAGADLKSELSLMMRSLAGGRMLQEAQELVYARAEQWIQDPDPFVSFLGCRMLLHRQEYVALIGFLRSEEVCAQDGRLQGSAFRQCLSGFLLAAAYLSLDRQEEAAAWFRAAWQIARSERYDLLIFLFYDSLMELINDPEITDAGWRRDEDFVRDLARFRRNAGSYPGQMGKDYHRTLTIRECEVTALVRKGCSNKEIAAQLQISENTVKTILKSVFRKLKVQKRSEL